MDCLITDVPKFLLIFCINFGSDVLPFCFSSQIIFFSLLLGQLFIKLCITDLTSSIWIRSLIVGWLSRRYLDNLESLNRLNSFSRINYRLNYWLLDNGLLDNGRNWLWLYSNDTLNDDRLHILKSWLLHLLWSWPFLARHVAAKVKHWFDHPRLLTNRSTSSRIIAILTLI